MERAAIVATAVLAIAALTAETAQAAPSIPAYLGAAVADSARPAEDRQRDAERKPAETLAFAGVKPGDITFASNQFRIRLPRDPSRAWGLTQAVVARLSAGEE